MKQILFANQFIVILVKVSCGMNPFKEHLNAIQLILKASLTKFKFHSVSKNVSYLRIWIALNYSVREILQ